VDVDISGQIDNVRINAGANRRGFVREKLNHRRRLPSKMRHVVYRPSGILIAKRQVEMGRNGICRTVGGDGMRVYA
jgi:hypothetical protein